MQYITGKEFKLNNTCVTLGKFDGIHLGHQKLLRELQKDQKPGQKSVMFSFALTESSKVLFTEEERRNILSETGIDVLIAYPFNEETKAITADVFLSDILIKKLGMKKIVVGTDNRFGFQRAGSPEMLAANAKTYGYEVMVCKKAVMGGEEISSTRIKRALQEAKIPEVNAMLGREYFIQGSVVRGKQLGRTIGFPTINVIPPGNKLLPPCGVYVSKTELNGKEYFGITNIGVRPTVGKQEVNWVETHLLDFDSECYGALAKTKLYRFIRPETVFSGLDELKNQIAEDKKAAEYFCRRT